MQKKHWMREGEKRRQQQNIKMTLKSFFSLSASASKYHCLCVIECFPCALLSLLRLFVFYWRFVFVCIHRLEYDPSIISFGFILLSIMDMYAYGVLSVFSARAELSKTLMCFQLHRSTISMNFTWIRPLCDRTARTNANLFGWMNKKSQPRETERAKNINVCLTQRLAFDSCRRERESESVESIGR